MTPRGRRSRVVVIALATVALMAFEMALMWNVDSRPPLPMMDSNGYVPIGDLSPFPIRGLPLKILSIVAPVFQEPARWLRRARPGPSHGRGIDQEVIWSLVFSTSPPSTETLIKRYLPLLALINSLVWLAVVVGGTRLWKRRGDEYSALKRWHLIPPLVPAVSLVGVTLSGLRIIWINRHWPPPTLWHLGTLYGIALLCLVAATLGVLRRYKRAVR